MRHTAFAILLAASQAVAFDAPAQDANPTGYQVSALPALNYDSDEGFGYGVVAGIYAYGDGRRAPYIWAIEPVVFFTTEGRREVSAIFDAPHVLSGAGRVTAFGAYERDCCLPYYGLGNGTTFDPALADRAPAPNFYTYTRRRWSLVLDFQWRVRPALRFLVGMAVHHNSSASRDPDTQFGLDSASGVISTSETSTASFGPKVGIVFDTRDHERDPHRGLWLDALAWFGASGVGNDSSFARLTATARSYLPVTPRLTVAVRVVGEHVAGSLPVSMLTDIGSSFRDFAGVGGAESVRGVLRNRFLGESRFMSNLELRWRGNEFRAVGQRWRLGVVAFIDLGRVWDERVGAIPGSDIHVGGGAGVRITWGDSFIVAVDGAHGSEAGTQLYIGLGHVF